MGPALVGLVCVALAALFLFALLRPGPSAADTAATIASIEQMDIAQGQANAERAKAQRERQSLF